MNNKKVFIIALTLITAAGIFFRLWHIEFGLPHSFYADEPEIAELAIKYTYELKSIVSEGDYYKLIPISYVYGTFPSYLFTFFTMGFSKISNVIGTPATKYELYVAMRVFNALLSFLIAPVIAFIFYKQTKRRWSTIILYFLLALNWKLIVHAHYINADIILALLISLSFLTSLLYVEKEKNDKALTIITGVLMGLAVGTKITFLIALPLYIWIFYKKEQFRNVAVLLLTALGAFILSNPFSIIFAQDFVYRIYEMVFKEGGLVFDSVDYGYLKYIYALRLMASGAIVLLSLVGIFSKKKNKFDLFLVLNIVVYLIFFSIQSRRVDRWLLPILPAVLYFSVWGMEKLESRVGRFMSYFFIIVALGYYLYFPSALLTQFRRWTPKSEAYLWMRENPPPLSTKLVYTEEGLDPMNKLPGTKVYQYEVYSPKNAQLFYPKDPSYYDYVVVSSKPMENHRRPEVKEAYPEYYLRWNGFFRTLNTTEKFELVKDFSLSKPNLIPLSDVFVYRNLDKKPLPVSGVIPFLQTKDNL